MHHAHVSCLGVSSRDDHDCLVPKLLVGAVRPKALAEPQRSKRLIRIDVGQAHRRAWLASPAKLRHNEIRLDIAHRRAKSRLPARAACRYAIRLGSAHRRDEAGSLVRRDCPSLARNGSDMCTVRGLASRRAEAGQHSYAQRKYDRGSRTATHPRSVYRRSMSGFHCTACPRAIFLRNGYRRAMFRSPDRVGTVQDYCR